MEREESVIRNLEDAGCAPDTIQDFMCRCKAGKTAEALRLLAAHRRQLLDQLHREQKRIDCLDYLVYQINRQQPHK